MEDTLTRREYLSCSRSNTVLSHQRHKIKVMVKYQGTTVKSLNKHLYNYVTAQTKQLKMWKVGIGVGDIE